MSTMTFGKKTKDRANDGGGAHKRYIKGFQEARQQITFLLDDPENEFIHVWTHYDPKAQTWYPCGKDAGGEDCIGCSYPVEHEEWNDAWLKDNWVSEELDLNGARDRRAKQDPGWGVRGRSGKYIFPAVDEQGYTNIYAIGKRAWSSLCSVYEELGTIVDQVFTLKCSAPKKTSNVMTFMGSGLEAQKPKYEVPGMKAISETLGDKYLYAYDKYIEEGVFDGSGRPESVDSDPDLEGNDGPVGEVEPPEGEAQDTPPPAKKAAAKAPAKAPAKAAPKASPAKTDGKVPAHLAEFADQFVDGWDPNLVARDAKPSDLKFWLENYPPDGIEYPPGSPRGVLVGMVEKAQVEPPF